VSPLSPFGVVAVSAMLLFYALEDRSASFVLLFAVACLASAVYGFLQGAWPFGIVETIWAGVAVRRWQRGGRGTEQYSSRPRCRCTAGAIFGVLFQFA